MEVAVSFMEERKDFMKCKLIFKKWMAKEKGLKIANGRLLVLVWTDIQL